MLRDWIVFAWWEILQTCFIVFIVHGLRVQSSMDINYQKEWHCYCALQISFANSLDLIWIQPDDTIGILTHGTFFWKVNLEKISRPHKGIENTESWSVEWFSKRVEYKLLNINYCLWPCSYRPVGFMVLWFSVQEHPKGRIKTGWKINFWNTICT